MKPYSIVIRTLFAGLILIAQNSFANEVEKQEEVCKIPKLLDFNLPEYALPEKHEVAPESVFSFKVSDRGAHPKKIKVMAKDKSLPLEITQNSSFIYVKGKLPPEFTGQFVRLHAFVGTELGCIGKDGWLIKVAAGTEAAASPAIESAKTETTPTAQ